MPPRRAAAAAKAAPAADPAASASSSAAPAAAAISAAQGYQKFQVKDAQSIKDFVQALNLDFQRGNGFYELTKPEDISPTKLVRRDPSSSRPCAPCCLTYPRACSALLRP